MSVSMEGCFAMFAECFHISIHLNRSFGRSTLNVNGDLKSKLDSSAIRVPQMSFTIGTGIRKRKSKKREMEQQVKVDDQSSLRQVSGSRERNIRA